ncbi:PAS domain S-box protein, partial [bacterium]|nr:PAS domain S-box protein [bacterium]
ERLMSAIEQAAETIVITDSDGTIQYVNPAFGRITGYTRAEAIGQNPRILKSGKQDDAFYKEMWDTLTRGEVWCGRIVNKRKDGSLYTEEATISPVRDASDAIVSYVAVKRDITQESALEDELRQTHKMEAVGQLAGGVAHDLNNLLTPILGYSELLQERLNPDDKEHEFLDEIVAAGLAARDLVYQLLAFSRKQVLEYEILNLNDVIAGFEKLLRGSIREDIEIDYTLSSDIKMIQADAGQIKQIIMNLAVNAQDAIPHGGKLTVATTMENLDNDYAATHHDVPPGEYVMLAITDTGCGMDSETVEQAFEPFFSTKGDKGTGLGLATVYGIVKQHEGSIWVYSEPGKGTIFKIYLPAFGQASGKRETSIEQTGEEKTSEEVIADPGGGATILLTEDNEQLRALARTILERTGYTVLLAEDGETALMVMDEHDGVVDLLLTDVVMPGMNGRELFTKAAEKLPGLKVLYMSGYSHEVITHRGVLDKGLAFIQKPFTLRSLTAKVREVLEKE